MIWRKPTRGNDAVNVGMQQQVLSPGVQDADHTDLGSQVFRIRCDFQQGLCAGGEQQIVKQARVLQGQDIQFVRHGEHGMEIAGSQEFALAGLRLTLGAVPISTRVVGDGLIFATLASVAMPAEGSGAAALNGPKGRGHESIELFIINMFIERTSQILIPPITLIRVREGICFGLYSVAIVGVRARAKDLLPSMLQLFRRWLTIAKASRLPCSQ